MSFDGKVALVTGGSSGIGLATAKRLAGAGARVFVTGRRQGELDRAVGEIGGGAVAVQADSAKLGDLDRVYETIGAAAGRLDLLFANAGILEKAPVGAITEAMVDRLLSINLKGTIFTVQKALPLMAAGGAIVLTGSTVGVKGVAGSSVYSATKAAIRNLARGWIVDLKGRGIRINVVSPGAIATPGLAAGAATADAAAAGLKAMAAAAPMGRVGEAEEIAEVVAFLLSDAAGLMTGAEVQADGGWAQI